MYALIVRVWVDKRKFQGGVVTGPMLPSTPTPPANSFPKPETPID